MPDIIGSGDYVVCKVTFPFCKTSYPYIAKVINSIDYDCISIEVFGYLKLEEVVPLAGTMFKLTKRLDELRQVKALSQEQLDGVYGMLKLTQRG